MNSTLVKDYQNRIVQAGQDDLLLINYEMLMISIQESVDAIERNEPAQVHKSIESAKRLLRELSDNLDFRYDLSKDLMAIYIYVSKQLINTSINMAKEPLISANKVLNTLLKGWQEASKKQAIQKPIIGNGQKVYAGLTYGRGSLVETVYDNAGARGFRA